MEQIRPRNGTGLNIVLIEPHEAVRMTLARRLRSDVRVASLREAPSIASASEMIASSTPDVVIVDPGPADPTGNTALDALRLLRERTTWFLIAAYTVRGHEIRGATLVDARSDLHLLKGLRTVELVGALVRGLSARNRWSTAGL